MLQGGGWSLLVSLGGSSLLGLLFLLLGSGGLLCLPLADVSVLGSPFAVSKGVCIHDGVVGLSDEVSVRNVCLGGDKMLLTSLGRAFISYVRNLLSTTQTRASCYDDVIIIDDNDDLF